MPCAWLDLASPSNYHSTSDMRLACSSRDQDDQKDVSGAETTERTESKGLTERVPGRSVRIAVPNVFVVHNKAGHEYDTVDYAASQEQQRGSVDPRQVTSLSVQCRRTHDEHD